MYLLASSCIEMAAQILQHANTIVEREREPAGKLKILELTNASLPDT